MAMRWYSVSVLSNFEKKVAEAIKDAAAPAAPRGRDRRGDGADRGGHRDPPRQEGADREAVHARLRAGEDGACPTATYHLITSINRVTGFLGPQGKPTPMRDDEVARILNQVVEGQERPRSIITFQTGEQVNVTDGPFEGFSGMVEEVDQAQQPAQGVGVDLRPGHPGRAGIHAGRQGLVSEPVGGEGGAPPGPRPRPCNARGSRPAGMERRRPAWPRRSRGS